MCKRNHSVASCMTPTGTWPATQTYTLTRNQTSDLLVCRTVPNPLSHTTQEELASCHRLEWPPLTALPVVMLLIPRYHLLAPLLVSLVVPGEEILFRALGACPQQNARSRTARLLSVSSALFPMPRTVPGPQGSCSMDT